MDRQDGSVESLLQAGQKWMDAKLYDRAMVEFHKAYKADKSVTIRALGGLFDTAKATGDYDGVIAVGSNLLVNMPENIELANLLGNAYRRQGNTAQAINLYEHCLNHNKNADLPAYNMAAAMAHSDLYDNQVISAIKDFEKNKEFILPDLNEEGIHELVEYQNQLNSIKAAQEEEESAEDQPEQKTAEQQDWKEALSSEVQEEKKEDKEKQAKAEDLELDVVELFRYLRNQVGMDTPTGMRLFRALGLYALKNQHAEVAWRCFTRLSFNKPKDQNIQCFLALSYVLRGQVDLAIDKLSALLGETPAHRYTNINLGFIYYKAKNNRLVGRKYYITTAKLLEKSQGYFDLEKFQLLGDQFYAEGKYNKALEVYRVIAEELHNLDILIRLGRILINLEEFDEAAYYVQEVMKLAPDNSDARIMLKKLRAYYLNKGNEMLEARKFAVAAENYEKCLKIESSRDVMEQALIAYEQMKDHDQIHNMKMRIRQHDEEERLQALEVMRIEKIKKAVVLEKERQIHKAIRAYEEAFHLKVDKELFHKLISLYKKTRQNAMVEDLTTRFNKMVEREQKMAQYQRDLERENRVAMEDGTEQQENSG